MHVQINKILVSHPLYQEIEQSLRGKVPKEFRFLPEGEATLADFQWADAFVAFKAPSTMDLTNIQWVHSLGAGVDRFIFHQTWQKDILLTRTIASFGPKISEYCLSYILRDLQLHKTFENSKRSKEWNPSEPLAVSSLKVVIFGTGVIGQEVAYHLNRFGADVSGVSLSGKPKTPFSQIVTPDQAGTVLSGAHWVINTLPLTPQTTDLFDNKLFQDMNMACFINVGRGASVNETDLLEALEQRKLRLAVLDVFREEPLPPVSPFWNHSDIIVTPHIAAVTSLDDAVTCFLSTLEKVEAGIRPENTVDIDKGY